MQWVEPISEVLVRAVYLLGLSVVPPWLSPSLGQVAHPVVEGLVSALVLSACMYGLVRLRRLIPGRLGGTALVLLGMAPVAALVSASVFRGESAPLGGGVPYVAPALWLGLGSLAAALAERRFGHLLRKVRPIALVLVLGAGAFLLARAPWLFSREQSWLEVLRRDPEAIFAMEALLREPLRQKNFEVANQLVDRCFAASPDACSCHAGRAEVATRLRRGSNAIVHAREAADRCPESIEIRAVLVEALSQQGDFDGAEREARAALAKGSTARVHHALAVALDRQNRAKEALEEAKRAIELGAGRDSVLLLGALWVMVGDLEQATTTLQPLVTADPKDAAALYNLALIADKQNDYNRARQGYLAALGADPGLASARYNLAILARRHHVFEEARHHARSYVSSFPEDPRGAELIRMTESQPLGAGRGD